MSDLCNRGHDKENSGKTKSRNCRICHSVYLKTYFPKYYKNHKEPIAAYKKEYSLKYKYRMSLAEYNQRMRTQNRRCAICQIEKQVLDVDHNHMTGHNRELLCNNCNRGIGHLKDNPAIMRKAAEYIEKHMEVVYG